MTMLTKVEEKGSMLAVYVDEPCEAEQLCIRRAPVPQPKDGEILIRRRGLYPGPPGEREILGLEAAGVVVSPGPGVKRNWRPGDRVMALLSGGGYAEFVAAPEELLMPVPSHLTLLQAAGIPEAWLTAYQLLHFITRIEKGETILIHAGASGVGTAAVQLVRLAEAVPIVTAGSSEKLQMAEELGAAAGFNYNEVNFSEQVLRFTEGRGADVILDCIGAAYWEKNVQCLAVDGRWVLYGTMGGKTIEGDLLSKLLLKRGQLLCTLLRSRSLQYKADLVKSFTEKALPYFSPQSPKSLRPVMDRKFPMEDIAKAHIHMEDNKNIGKIIIEMVSS